jgi:hypothetical protein
MVRIEIDLMERSALSATADNLQGVILTRYLSFIFLIALSVFFFSAARSQPADLAGGPAAHECARPS